MKIGIEIGDFAWAGGPSRIGETIIELARVADDAGFALIGVGDHLWQGPHMGGPEQPMLECFTTLGVIAAHTRRCRLGPMVAAVHLREPGLLAKAMTSLDVLSGGRAILGIGVGWYEEEAVGLGIGYPPLRDRYEMLEEAVQVCLRMWAGDNGDGQPYTGRHYRLARVLNAPQSLSRPHPPIVIGGGGQRRTLPLVARYADACNFYPGPDLPATLESLRRHCAEQGREYTAIEKTCIMPFAVGADGAGSGELVEELRRLAGAGIQTVIGILAGPYPVQQVETIGAKVLPAVADA